MKSLISPLNLVGLLIAVQFTVSCGSSGGGGSGASPSPTPQPQTTNLPSTEQVDSSKQKVKAAADVYAAAKANLKSQSGFEFSETFVGADYNKTLVSLAMNKVETLQAAYDANPLISKTAVRSLLETAATAQKALIATKSLPGVTAEIFKSSANTIERVETEGSLLAEVLQKDGLKSGQVLSADETATVISKIKVAEDSLDPLGLKLIVTYSESYDRYAPRSLTLKVELTKSKIIAETIASSVTQVKELLPTFSSIPSQFEDELFFKDAYELKKSSYASLRSKLNSTP